MASLQSFVALFVVWRSARIAKLESRTREWAGLEAKRIQARHPQLLPAETTRTPASQQNSQQSSLTPGQAKKRRLLVREEGEREEGERRGSQRTPPSP